MARRQTRPTRRKRTDSRTGPRAASSAASQAVAVHCRNTAANGTAVPLENCHRHGEKSEDALMRARTRPKRYDDGPQRTRGIRVLTTGVAGARSFRRRFLHDLSVTSEGKRVTHLCKSKKRPEPRTSGAQLTAIALTIHQRQIRRERRQRLAPTGSAKEDQEKQKTAQSSRNKSAPQLCQLTSKQSSALGAIARRTWAVVTASKISFSRCPKRASALFRFRNTSRRINAVGGMILCAIRCRMHTEA